jgi:hypothetical protein
VYVTVDTITDADIRDLFKRHCKCRSSNTARISHSRDCDSTRTDACRLALHGFVVKAGNPVAVSDEARRDARALCAHFISNTPTYKDYIPDGGWL